MGCVISKPKVCQNCQACFFHMQQTSKAMHDDNLSKSETGENIPRASFSSNTLEELSQEEGDLEKKSKEVYPKGKIKANICSESIMSEFDRHDAPSILNNVVKDIPPGDPFRLMEALLKMNVKLDDSAELRLRVKEKLVLYFTSLRGVRKTYEDCCHVRMILKGLGVSVDERDLSMHLWFKQELKERLGESNPGGGLPKLFIGTKYIGGVEEIQRMHELGELEKLIKNCEKVESIKDCEACGDFRFVPCYTCSGSCKIFNENCKEDENGFQRCTDCNENGLIRCPFCCD